MASSGPIRFGSFNHNRKLTDSTLRLWAELLSAVPQSRLVLKASAQSDSDTQRLLRRRMLRQGLNPERVDWLALTKGPVEHMQQYATLILLSIQFPMVDAPPLVKHCGWESLQSLCLELVTSVE